jgi:hypothetical protein
VLLPGLINSSASGSRWEAVPGRGMRDAGAGLEAGAGAGAGRGAPAPAAEGPAGTRYGLVLPPPRCSGRPTGLLPSCCATAAAAAPAAAAGGAGGALEGPPVVGCRYSASHAGLLPRGFVACRQVVAVSGTQAAECGTPVQVSHGLRVAGFKGITVYHNRSRMFYHFEVAVALQRSQGGQFHCMALALHGTCTAWHFHCMALALHATYRVRI